MPLKRACKTPAKTRRRASAVVPAWLLGRLKAILKAGQSWSTEPHFSAKYSNVLYQNSQNFTAITKIEVFFCLMLIFFGKNDFRSNNNKRYRPLADSFTTCFDACYSIIWSYEVKIRSRANILCGFDLLALVFTVLLRYLCYVWNALGES